MSARAFADDASLQAPSSYVSLNLSFPSQSPPIIIEVSREQSLAYHWGAGQKIPIKIFVEDQNSQKHYLRDSQGLRSWTLIITENLTGSLSVIPALNNYTGRLTITADDKLLSAPTPYLSESVGRTVEKIYEGRFRDGAAVRVHFTDQILAETGVAAAFPKQVMDAAVIAYQTITQFEGFNTPGYSFAEPDKNFAYDPDKVIDVYLGNSNSANEFKFHGFSTQSFHDAPCFDTVKLSSTAYQATILLPANYREFIQNWERLNPSSLGARNVNLDLRGTLMHEMLHVVLFYYNKNLNRENSEKAAPAPAVSGAKNLDWYVEGLARYFETFAGARHDFYSQGFRETLPNKIRFSRGGSNYFMRYPDQPFTELRYENAIFWKFIDYHFGMKAIEGLSRSFRGTPPENFGRQLESATHTPIRGLLKKFALSALLNDFGLKEDAVYLKEVARTRLTYKDHAFYLLDGYEGEKKLGAVCRTDWISRWTTAQAHFDELTVAGDSTNASDVSGWATDFYEINLDGQKPELPVLSVCRQAGEEPLLVQLVLQTRGGSVIVRDWDELPGSTPRRVSVQEVAVKEGLTAQSIEKVYLLITNLDPHKTCNYEIRS